MMPPPNTDGKRLTATYTGPNVFIVDASRRHAGLLPSVVAHSHHLIREEGAAYSIAFSPNDDVSLAVGCVREVVKLWNVTNGTCSQVFEHNVDEDVDPVAFNASGTLLATGSALGTATLWCVADGTRSATFVPPRQAALLSIAFMPDGSHLATGSNEGKTRLWRIADGVCVATLKGRITSSASFSPDSTTVATSEKQQALLWSVPNSNTPLRALKGHKGPLWSIVFSPNGALIATGSGDCTTRLWRRSDGVPVLTMEGHSESVECTCFSPDSSLLATGSSDKTTKLWRVSDGVCLATIGGHKQLIRSVAFNRDGSLLATGSEDTTVKLWRLDDCIVAALKGHRSFVTIIAISPDGEGAATGSDDNTIKLWRIADDWTCTATLYGHSGMLNSVAYSSDGALIATGSDDKTAKLWRVADRVCLATLDGYNSPVEAVAFSLDGTMMTTACKDGTVKRCRIDNSNGVHVIADFPTLHQNILLSAAFSSDGNILATCSQDYTTKVRRSSDGTCLATLTHGAFVWRIAINFNGTLVATAGVDRKTKVWRVNDRKCVLTLTDEEEPRAVTFSRDGTILATSSEDNAIKLWRVTDGKRLAILPGHRDRIFSIEFLPDGTRIVTGSKDNTALVWRIADGICTSTLIGHRLPVTATALSSDLSIAASGSCDGEVKLWRIPDRVCIATLVGHKSNITSVAFSLDGSVLAVGHQNCSTNLWRVADGVCSTTLQGHQDEVRFAAFNDDGSTLATLARDGEVMVWSVHHKRCIGQRLGFTTVEAAMVHKGTLSLEGTDQAASVVCCFHFGVADEAQTITATINISLHVPPAGVSSNGQSESTFVQLSSQSSVKSSSLSTQKKIFDRKLQVFPHISLNDLTRDELPIAGGSTSVVYRATWYGTEHYALKLFHTNLLQSSSIKQELDMVPFIQHPNIVRVVAIVDDAERKGPVGLLMKLAQHTLTHALSETQQPRPPEALILSWLHDISVAIIVAHQLRIVHSDIKPDNILISFDANRNKQVAMVTDFGSSKMLSTATAKSTAARGTPMFMAPEYSTGPTKAADVFSFGMTMWSVLAPPGTEHGLGFNVASALAAGRRPPLGVIRPQLARLIDSCWAAEASHRPSIEKVEVALRSFFPTPLQPSLHLWYSHLSSFGLQSACAGLDYHYRNGVFFSDPITEPTHLCYQFARNAAGGPVNRAVKRVEMVGLTPSAESIFSSIHKAEVQSRARNRILRNDAATDAASVAAMKHLASRFLPREASDSSPEIMLAWHGTDPSKIADICRDGPRALARNDEGYFGVGSYFALEANYALYYSNLRSEPQSNELVAILFAISVSEVKAITPALHYNESDPFCKLKGGAITAGYDAHFIPVSDCGYTHPLTGVRTPKDVHYQAVDVSSDKAEFYELVISNHTRCVPLAVVYYENVKS